MYKVTLNRITAGKLSGLRTNNVTGECNELPMIGKSFEMLAEPLDPTVGSTRYIETSPIQEIDDCITYMTFKTESGSHYRLDIIG